MPNPIKPRRSYTANSVPLTTDLAQNELAVNWTDGKLFTKNAAGQILTLTLGGGGGGGNASLPATIQGSLSVAGDDQFDSVSLLLPFNGNLVDRSNYQHVVTAYGSAAATGTAKYGGNSLALNGSTDYLSVPSSSVFSFPGDFTIEAWVYLTSASGPWTGAYGACVAATYTGSGTNPGWQLRVNGDSSGYDTINLYTGATDLNWSASISLNAWHHVAVCRSGSSIRAFLDGTQVGSTATNSDSLTPTNANTLYIGKLVYYNYHFYLPGRIDDLRLSRTARYTANFTPPTAALPTTGTYSLSPVTLSVTGGSGSGGGGLSWSSVPASATASGTAGQIAYDSTYLYVCTATNTWVRYASSLWLDADAAAFNTAAGITDSTQASAVNTLVGSLKTAGLWSKLIAAYPFVGGTASSHKWNLKDPRDLDAAYRLVFVGTWTHASTGVAGDGSSAYADTKLNAASTLSATSYAEMTYYRTNPSQSQTYPSQGARIDSTSPIQSFQTHFYSGDGNTYVDYGQRVVVANSTYGTATGAYSISRTSDSLITVYRNGVSKATGTATNNQIPSLNIYLGALNYNSQGNANWHSREMSFYAVSSGLTDAEMASLYSAVQAFQATLGRNV